MKTSLEAMERDSVELVAGIVTKKSAERSVLSAQRPVPSVQRSANQHSALSAEGLALSAYH